MPARARAVVARRRFPMSRSFRSQKESVIAERGIERDGEGRPLLPRIVERAPAPGDIHPLSKRVLRRLLSGLPVEYLHGLSRIELRARELPLIGQPFGSYWVGERAIVLYSLPLTFHCRFLGWEFRRSLVRFRAGIEVHRDGFTVSWPKPKMLALWFYSFVLTHELGHHFVEQYKSRNSHFRSLNKEELVADLHARRRTDELLASLRKRRAT